MLGKIFKRQQVNNDTEPVGGTDFREAIIIEGDFLSGAEFGETAEQAEVVAIENRIHNLLQDDADVDGHEFGEATFAIYLYCKSADESFEGIRSVLQESSVGRYEVTLQYGPPEDPNTKEKHFTLS